MSSNPAVTKAEQARKLQQAKIDSAWQALATNKDLQFVLDHDLQRQFNFLGSVFQSEDGFNASAAAKRDGQRSVVAYLLKRIRKAKIEASDDEPEEKGSTRKRKSVM